MEPNQKNLIIIITLGILVVIALVLGLVLGLQLKDKEEPKIEDEHVDITNNYTNTPILIGKYHVINNTTVKDGIEDSIRNRLLTGFENWNLGFKAWKEWGNILYTPDSIYNVHGARLSLAQYQAAMDISLQQANITMGDFHNMLIVDDFCAIHYDFTTDGKLSKVMEFVQFKNYGNETNPDTRVVEGWGSTRDSSYYGLITFQGEDERRKQEELNSFLENYQLPYTNDLDEKYFIRFPSNNANDEDYKNIKKVILEGFESWNNGISSYLDWVNKSFDVNATSSSLNETVRSMEQYRKEITELFENELITKLYFDNILIRENWTAIHYRYRSYNKKDISRRIGDRMEFFKFKIVENGIYKIVANWIQ